MFIILFLFVTTICANNITNSLSNKEIQMYAIVGITLGIFVVLLLAISLYAFIKICCLKN